MRRIASKYIYISIQTTYLVALLGGCATAPQAARDDAELAYDPTQHTRRVKRRLQSSPLGLPRLPTTPEEARAWRGDGLGPRELELVSVNTKEETRVTLFGGDGRMDPDAAAELTWTLRDWRRDEQHRPPPRLLTLLYLVAQHYQQPLHLVSGYRHPKRPGSGSRHGTGCAADFYIEGVEPAEVAHFIRSTFEQVGVGYYPRSGFVHLDVREASYYWIDHSGPGEPQRHEPIEVSPTPPPGSDWTVHTHDLPAAYLGSR